LLTESQDKVADSEKDAANVKFQEIAFAYAVLSDPRRRSRYDATGRTSESLDLEDDDFNWTEFFRTQFKEVVTTAAIEQFKKEYVGSGEEQLAIIEAYVNGEGEMDYIFSHVMLSNPLEDEERFRAIIDAEIAEKRVEAYPAYVNETKTQKKRRVKEANKEAEEAAEMARELGVEDELFGSDRKKSKGAPAGKKKQNTAAGAENEDLGGLAALIQQRQKQRAGNFLADLEAKYAPKSGKRKAEDDEPPEEAFQKTADRHKRNSGSKKADRPIASPRKSKRSKK
jgi:DnaJ family protein C protein 9